MKIGRALGMVVACTFFVGSTSVYAEDTAAPATSAAPQTANIQLASVNPSALPPDTKANVDPLHADARWPQFKNCIDNTNTPAAFQGCLQMAFMGVTPDNKVLALLTR